MDLERLQGRFEFIEGGSDCIGGIDSSSESPI